MKLRLPIALATALLSTLSFSSFAANWTGAGADDYWSTIENWGGTLPATGEAIEFSAGSTVVVDDVYSTGTLVLQEGAKLTGKGGGITSEINASGDMTIHRTGAVSLGSSNGEELTIYVTGRTTLKKQATLNIYEGVTFSTQHLRLGDSYNHSGNTVINQMGGDVTIYGSDSSSNNTASFLLGHWDENVGHAQYNISGGTLNVLNAIMIVSRGVSGGSLSVSGDAVVNTKGITLNSGVIIGEVNVSGGRLNIGSSGIVTGLVNDLKALNFSGGTVGAYEDWNTAVKITLGGDVAFDTLDSDSVTAEARTITLNGQLTGTGGFTKTGIGTLILTDNTNDFTGAITVEGGTLLVKDIGVLGKGSSLQVKSGGILSWGETSTLMNASFDRTITGSGQIHLYMNTVHTNDKWVDIGSSFTGDVYLKSGYLTVSKSAGTYAELGTGKLIMEAGTRLYTQLMGSATESAGDFSANIQLNGNAEWNFASGTNTRFSVDVTASSGVTLTVTGATGDDMIEYTGDWSKFGGIFNVYSGRTLFNVGEDGVMLMEGMRNGGGGIRIQSGTLIMGASGITSSSTSTAVRIGTDGTGPASQNNRAGSVTLGGTTDFSVNGGQGLYLCANSVLTINTNKWNAATSEFLTNDSVTITIVGNGIRESGSLVVTGSGLLDLTVANTFSGTFTIDGGIVNAQHANALGNGSNNLTIKNEGKLTTTVDISSARKLEIGENGGEIEVDSTSLTFTGGVTGSGTLIKSGAGKLLLSGAGDYSGTINLDEGDLYIGAGTLSTTTTATINVNADVEVSSDAKSTGVSANFNVAAGKTLILASKNSAGGMTGYNEASTVFNGNINLNGTGSLEMQRTVFTIAAGQTVTGDRLLLSYNATLNVAGDVTFNTATEGHGYLSLGAVNNGSTAGVLNILDGGSFTAKNATLYVSNGSQTGSMNIATGGEATLKGLYLDGNGSTLNLNGGILTLESSGLKINNPSGRSFYNMGKFNFNSGKLIFTEDASYTLTATNSNDATGYFTLGNAAETTRTIEVASGKAVNFDGVIAGSGGFIKTGAGELLLNKENVYTGDTVLQEGKLTTTVQQTATANYILDATGTSLLAIAGSLKTGQSITAYAGNTATVSALNVDGGVLKYADTASTTFGEYNALTIDALTIGSGKVEFNFTGSTAIASGEYTLVNLTNAISGTYFVTSGTNTILSDTYGTITGLETDGTRYVTSIKVSADSKTLSLLVDGDAAILHWDNTGNGNWYKEGLSGYWEVQNTTIANPADVFYNGDIVHLVDVDGGSDHVITIGEDVAPGGIYVSADSQKYTLDAASTGKITGAGSLSVTGTGVLEIGITNTFTGGTTVSAGEVILNATGALGTGPIAISGGEVILNAAGALGTGAVTLGGDGILTLGAASALGSTNTVATSGGTIKWGTGVTDDVSSLLSSTNSTSLTFDTNGNDVTFGTVLTATGMNYTKAGEGTLSLTQASSLRGSVTVEEGTLNISGGGGSGVIYGEVTVESGAKLASQGDAFGYNGGSTAITKLTLENGATWELRGTSSQNASMGGVEIIMDGATVTTYRTDSQVEDISFTIGMIANGGTTGTITTLASTDVSPRVSTIKARLLMRQEELVITTGANSELHIEGVIYSNGWNNFAHNLVKKGDGLLVLSANNTYGTNGGSNAKGNTDILAGTLQVGSGGTTGTLGAGIVTVSTGASLIFNRNADLTVNNVLSGAGDIEYEGGAVYTLGGNSDFSGNMTIIEGGVTLAHANALGSGSTVTIQNGATLDYGSMAGANSVSLIAEDGAILNNINGAAHSLTVESGSSTGSGDMTVDDLVMEASSSLTLTGSSLAADTLTLQGTDSRITVDGDITIANGGEFVIDSTNENTGIGNAFVQGAGTVSVSGTYKLNVNSNLGAGQHTYYLFGGSGIYSAIDATLVFANGKEYLSSFYTLDSTDFTTNGTVVINRSNEIAQFVNDADVTALGATYTPDTEDSFLGAKAYTSGSTLAERSNPVVFDVTYDTGSIGAYKLTSGLGWLDMQSEMNGSDKLVISHYNLTEQDKIDYPDFVDNGIIISNNNNSYSGETHILDAHVVLDATSTGGITGGAINLLGTGDVVIGGTEALLELSPNGTGDTGDYTFGNNITLVDGATLAQTSGSTELSGTIRVASSTASIQNATSQDLIFTGSLVTENNGVMVLKGANSAAATDGNFLLDGATGDIETLQLEDQAHFLLDSGSDASITSLKMTSGTDVNIAGDSTLHLAAVSGVADSRLILAGGILHATGNLTLNGTGNVTLRVLNPGISLFALSAYNTIEVDSGSTVTLNGLAAADGDFTKTGQGTLVLAGNYTPYAGTITIGQGPATLTASTYGGNLVVGIDGTAAELSVNPIVTINGLLTTNAGAITNVGSGSTLAGGLILNGGTFTGGSDITIQGTTLQIGEGSTATFGRDTIIRSNIAELAIGPNATVSFGRGSIIAGTITNGITLETGSTYSGTLNVRANEMTLKSGSTFFIAQEDLDLYTAGNIGITGTGAINVEQGTTFQLDSGLDFSNAPLFPSGVLTLIETTGTLTIGGANVVADQDYTNYLGENNYAWYSFSLLGGNKQLNLEIRQDVRFQDYAQTANEWAMVPIANDLATNSSSYQDELQQLGKALAMSTTGNARTNLSQLALSTSGIASGYVAQMEGMRRHTFDLLNRAVQEKTGVDRLNYEQHHSSIWVNGLGGSYKLKGDGNAIGNTTNVWGGTLGASTSVGENAVVGLSFTYTNSDTRLDRNMGKAEADTYYLDLFTRYRKDNWNIVGVVTGGMYSMDLERNLSLTGFNSTSQASPDGKQLMAMLQVGYEYTVSDDQNSILEPFAIVTGGYSEIDGYTENGAGTAGLVVDSQNQTLCSAGVGLRFAREYFTDRDTITKGRFEARAIILQDLAEVEGKVDASFIGDPASPFQVESKTPGRTAIIVGLGILHPLSQNLSLFANADGEFRSDANGVGGTVGVRYSF